MRLSLVTASDTDPLSEADLAKHLRLEAEGPEASALERMLASALEVFEDETGRQVGVATWELALPGFPKLSRESIEIPRPPLREVTSVTYQDSTGTEKTWDSSDWETVTPAGPFARPGVLLPKATACYPSARRVDGSVRIRFEAGYTEADIPKSLKETLLHMAAGFYEFREPQVLGRLLNSSPSFDRLLARWRLPVMA